MEGVLLFWLQTVLFFAGGAGDPLSMSWQSRQDARRFDCDRMSQAEAHDRFPADVPETGARTSTLLDRDALVCRRRLLPPDRRAPRDEQILDTLGGDVAALVKQAAGYGTAASTWRVEAFYPEPRMVQKIAGAGRVALAEAGVRVVDQVPLLAADDVDVLRGLSLLEALPVACQRYAAAGSLSDSDILLAFALLRPQESQLHAGLCTRGGWRWLR